MSIIAYVGLPGSGKSYDVVANQILPALDDGRRVVTNIPLNKDHIRSKHLNGEIVTLPLDVVAQQPEKIDEYATPGSVLILDEVWRLWPSGLKTDRIPQPFKSLLAEHRHRVDSQGRSMQIVLVTQDLAQIAAFARQLVEQTFHHTKLSDMGMRSSYRIDVFHGPVTGAVPPVNNRLREIFGKYKPEIFKCYKSHTMSESSKSGANELAMDTRGNRWKQPVVYMVAILIPLCFGYGLYTLYSIFGDPRPASAVGAAPAGNDPTAGEAAIARLTPSSASPRAPAPAREWRVTGVLEVGPEIGYAYVTDGRMVRTIALKHCRRDAMLQWICLVQDRWSPFHWPAIEQDNKNAGFNLYAQEPAL